jgi:LPXTG-motif cell wall-anchored protein
MRQFVNQHSYFFVGLLVLGAAALVLRRRRGIRRLIALAALLAVIVGAAAYLRTPGDVGSDTAFDRVLARGKPVALEFYSNF